MASRRTRHSTVRGRLLKLLAVVGVCAVGHVAGAEPIRAQGVAAGGPKEVGGLLRLELYADALGEAGAGGPAGGSEGDIPRWQVLAARVGAADDHYLANNFGAAFASYCEVLAQGEDADAAVRRRWALAGVMALAEAVERRGPSAGEMRKLSTYLGQSAPDVREGGLAQVLEGLMAEGTGRLDAAGRAYAAFVQSPWRAGGGSGGREAVLRARGRALERVRELYEAGRPARRGGVWAVVLAEGWRHRRTAHFEIYARNDVVAERVAEAAEQALAARCGRLGLRLGGGWEPRCELRVHGARAGLHAATGSHGPTLAVSRTDVQGVRVLVRKLDVSQDDPWLLSATLPHEVTHLLIADHNRSGGMPLVIDEGLAVLAEPPARQVMYQRLRPAEPPAVAGLLAVEQVPAPVDEFYAVARALAAWLGERCLGQAEEPGQAVVAAFGAGVPAAWWRVCGFASLEAAEENWRQWYVTDRPRPAMSVAEIARRLAPLAED